MVGKRPARDTVALVAAAGEGTRLGLGAKAFLQIEGQTLLERVVRNLRGCVGRVVVGVSADQLARARSELEGLAEVHAGQSSRQSTVYRLMELTTERIVLVYDVTRPFASRTLIEEVIEAAREHRAAAVFVPSHVPAARHRDGFVIGTVPKSEFLLPQIPLAFHREVLEEAYRNALHEGVEAQTTWELVVRLGMPVRVVRGKERNIKITVPFDWEIARKVVAPSLRVEREESEGDPCR